MILYLVVVVMYILLTAQGIKEVLGQVLLRAWSGFVARFCEQSSFCSIVVL